MSLLKEHLKPLSKSLMRFSLRFTMRLLANSENAAKKRKQQETDGACGINMSSLDSVFRAMERGDL